MPEPPPEPLSEPWLRGPIAEIHPAVMPLFFSFAQVREDLAKHVGNLRPEQIWHDVDGASIGFHLKHLAGSVHRITTYLMAEQLSKAQFESLDREQLGGQDAAALLALVDTALRDSEARLRLLNPASLYDARKVGRKELPSTVIGLLVHLAEHTQRHLGQIITLSKAVRRTD